MSKNAIIQEGGTSYQFTAKKLKTDVVGGGTCLWVPEDETTLTKKKITEEGTYKASDEGYYGYSEVEVDVTGATSTKRIAQNGTYKAEDDGLIGYSKVKVNVKGGNGSANSSGAPVVTYDSDGNIEYAPGGIGSSVVGWDEVDGNEYAIGVDSSGNLVKTKVPSGIEIATPPNKTIYTEGETINYSGIIVILKGGDGAMFSNSDYPNGRIPYSELTFTVEKAHGSGGGGGGEGHVINNVVSGQSLGTEVAGHGDWTIEIPHPARIIVFTYTNEGHAWYSFVISVEGIGGRYRHGNRGWKSIDQQQFVSAWQDAFSLALSVDSTIHSAEEAIQVLNSPSSYVEIPVQWKSRYDGRTFEDKFEITVTGGSSGTTGDTGGATGDTSSGSGYSDDSGGSSSGGGGGF